MKTLKATCTAAILALALSIPVYAGEMLTPGVVPPPPPPPPAEESITVNVATTASSDLGDLNNTGVEVILWFLASIF